MLMHRTIRILMGCALSALTLTLVASRSAVAQGRPGNLVTVLDAGGDPNTPDLDLAAVQRARRFNLFAFGDAGTIGMHMTGQVGIRHDSYGPCSNVLSSCQNWRILPRRNGYVPSSGLQWFNIEFLAGTPPSEYQKILAVAPSVANATGGGYAAALNRDLLSGGPLSWGPPDNTLGKLFAGITTTTDGGCQDMSDFGNAYLGSGLPMLAASNCPPSWPDGVWKGDHPIEESAYKTLFDQQGATFSFKYWQIPESLKRVDKPFLGTNFSSYGESTDHYKEILEAYGSVIPGGVGAPAIQGYPLGIVWHWEVFNFGLPSALNLSFYRATIINRSEDVYGVGIDYDSLYFGFMPGTGGTGAGGGQRYSDYWLPQNGVGLYHQSWSAGANGPCSEGSRVPAGGLGCGSGAAVSDMGYNNGGNAIIVLKSPIGDLRNKLFTRKATGAPCVVGQDAFCDPAHPLRGDTITFNHGHLCGYGGCVASTWNVNNRRGFGLLSSTEANVMDGRAPGSLSTAEAWRTFRNKLYPSVVGEFNKYVPGVQGPSAATWDWNHDGTPDTLYYDTCADQGCVTTDADTMPGGQINSYGNVGGVQGVGPVKLAAGDTTTFFVAWVGAGDSVATWGAINTAIDLYMTFFLVPEAPPPAPIAQSQITPATITGLNTTAGVNLYFGQDPEKWVDPFLLSVADAVEAGTYHPAEYGNLEALNPGLGQRLRDQGSNNFRRLEIYKSCDGGSTFTSDGNCVGDPATDETGAGVEFGWQAYAIFDADANGNIPNVFTDANVQGGRTYLYVLVGRSRGAKYLVNTQPTAGGPIVPDTVEFEPAIANPLSRASSDPNVISVYVPASQQAGTIPASATFNTTATDATVPFTLSFSDSVIAGTYQATFGNQFVVVRDSLISEKEVVQSSVRVEYVVDADVGGTATPTVVRTTSLARSGDLPTNFGGAASTASATIGDTVRMTATYSGLGYAVGRGSEAFFATTDLTGTSSTPTGVFALPDFTVDANNNLAGNYNNNGEAAFRGPNTIARLRLGPADTLVPRNDVNNYMVQWREQDASAAVSELGQYVVTWKSDAYGLPDGITPNYNNPAATEQEFQAALASRPASMTGLTDQATADLLGADVADLVAVKVPFTVRNVTFDRPVSIAMEARINSTALLGSGNDTVRVAVQPDQWIPGDELYFIEDVTTDSTNATGVVLDAGGAPIRVTHATRTFNPAVIGCDNPRPPTCNPVTARALGSTGYLPVADGDQLRFEYYAGFSPTSLYDFDVVGPTTGVNITAVTDSALREVRVVPNPFVIYSAYQSSVAASRILFTNLPPTGTLRIYSVAGQFLQQIDWTPADLAPSGQGQTVGGDLFYDLTTREGLQMATGLYIWVLTAPSDPTSTSSAKLTARGKFVIIRGDAR
jgi:hypothetical protein